MGLPRTPYAGVRIPPPAPRDSHRRGAERPSSDAMGGVEGCGGDDVDGPTLDAVDVGVRHRRLHEVALTAVRNRQLVSATDDQLARIAWGCGRDHDAVRR